MERPQTGKGTLYSLIGAGYKKGKLNSVTLHRASGLSGHKSTDSGDFIGPVQHRSRIPRPTLVGGGWPVTVRVLLRREGNEVAKG